MKNFSITDTKVLTENKVSHFDYRIYEYLCANFNIKKVSAYVRITDVAGHFALSLPQVKESLGRLSKIVIDGSPLLTIEDGPHYLIFDMPRHKKFLDSIGFRKHSAAAGWKNLSSYLKQNQDNKIKKLILYPNLDQFQLDDKLRTLSDEELNKLHSSQFQYPWILKNEKQRRTATTNNKSN